ncbi:MAG: sugar phosphate isomerase/epimerase [Planctomycetota bacterium]|nr:sugar phosphate isomerase/epimerase [Planctomycetota bacterium]
MKIAFTTLACPQWDLETICDRAHAYGYDAVDFRGLGADLDITLSAAFTTNIHKTASLIHAAGLEVSGISSSIRLCDENCRRQNLEEAKRTIDVALALACENVRVFGGGDPEKSGREKALACGRACLEEILALPGASRLCWLFETHDHWIKSADYLPLLQAFPVPSFGVLWDMHHTIRLGGETPAQTWAAVGERIRYTHIKDARREPGHPRAMADGWRYVPPGEGDLPLAECVRLLCQNGYTGYLVLEHEKRWHPELEEPEEILPKFAVWARRAMAEQPSARP